MLIKVFKKWIIIEKKQAPASEIRPEKVKFATSAFCAIPNDLE
ncbi:hypothetical protein NIASO_06765 [Niabella soli DSM 19437]|uniref:Uncharacterized protein n=1 Tax=Niabella soli DSM 19437 TaxID=929713 RepID=W0F2Z2_9BACT|nr:hypothetical protein NIASO_06765 [Niabella soli DSM 19437]